MLLYEKLHEVIVAVLCRQVERGDAQLGLGVDEGFVAKEDVGDLLVAVLRGEV